MIIRFDHLTYVCNVSDIQQVLNRFEARGYIEKFREETIPNIPPKMSLMYNHNETHSLYFLEKEGGLPIEVISYRETTNVGKNADYMDETERFTYYTKDVDSLMDFFKCVGMRVDSDGVCNARGVLDKSNTFIDIVEIDATPVNLDNEGYTCPTLFVDSYLKTKASIEGSGFGCTECSTIIINGREMKIFFVTGRNGEVLELISNK